MVVKIFKEKFVEIPFFHFCFGLQINGTSIFWGFGAYNLHDWSRGETTSFEAEENRRFSFHSFLAIISLISKILPFNHRMLVWYWPFHMLGLKKKSISAKIYQIYEEKTKERKAKRRYFLWASSRLIMYLGLQLRIRKLC